MICVPYPVITNMPLFQLRDLPAASPVAPTHNRVMWIDTSFYCTWGVKFTKLSPDKKDPLRSLMDSSM